MKIGILTFQHATNYGAVLQLYGLYQQILLMGYDVEVIDYIPPWYVRKSLKETLRAAGIRDLKKNPTIANVRMFFRRFIVTSEYQETYIIGFEQFVKSMKLSDRCTDKDWREILCRYDIIIVGSDQVWNRMNQERNVYFLDIATEESPKIDKTFKKISYAADSTTDAVDKRYVDKLRRELSDFDAISVRNPHTQRFVYKILGRNPIVVPDPTVLYEYDSIIDDENAKNTPYILAYVLGAPINGGHKQALNKIKEKYGDIPIIQVVMIRQYGFTILDEATEKRYNCRPDEWVTLIKNANCVYTDSYHCIMFALKYHVDFIAYYSSEERAERLIDMKVRYKLENKIVGSVEEMLATNSIEQTIDFNYVDEKFKEEKNIGENFLKTQLKLDRFK